MELTYTACMRRHRRLLAFVLACAVTPVWGLPFEVTPEVSIRNDDWYPLPVEDMTAAAQEIIPALHRCPQTRRQVISACTGMTVK